MSIVSSRIVSTSLHDREEEEEEPRSFKRRVEGRICRPRRGGTRSGTSSVSNGKCPSRSTAPSAALFPSSRPEMRTFLYTYLCVYREKKEKLNGNKSHIIVRQLLLFLLVVIVVVFVVVVLAISQPPRARMLSHRVRLPISHARRLATSGPFLVLDDDYVRRGFVRIVTMRLFREIHARSRAQSFFFSSLVSQRQFQVL